MIRLLVVVLVCTVFEACTCPGSGTVDDGGASGGGGGSGGGGAAGGGAVGGGTGASCVPAASACETALPCCDGTCVNGLCTSQFFCRGEQASCASGVDCCQGACIAGRCTACKPQGEGCASAQECCTGICQGTCQPVPTTDGLSCRTLGDSCTGGAALSDGGVDQGGCCSTLCRGGTCQKVFYCQPNGDLCHRDDECCGSACSVSDGGIGRCLLISGGGGGGCIQGGNPCSGASTCCSRLCVDPGSGGLVCLPAGGCRLTGTSCDDSNQCCGGGVNPNGTVECADGRCDNGQSCNGVGNLCKEAPLPDGGMVRINASTNCCNGGPANGLAVCKLDRSGIPRCYGGFSGTCPTGYTGLPPCCIGAAEDCQFREQCCDGNPCLPSADGGFACTALACRPLGGACASEADCCGGASCLEGVCRPFDESGSDGGSLCRANDAGCTLSIECCSTICVGGHCRVPIVCQARDATCTTSADCCSGLSCNATVGTCQENSCVSAGQTCAAGGTSCCAGLDCVDATYGTCGGTGECTCVTGIN